MSLRDALEKALDDELCTCEQCEDGDKYNDGVRSVQKAVREVLAAHQECGAVDRSGQRRCVFTPGHHEAENWTSHGDRGGWTWNDQPAEVEA